MRITLVDMCTSGNEILYGVDVRIIIHELSSIAGEFLNCMNHSGGCELTYRCLLHMLTV